MCTVCVALREIPRAPGRLDPDPARGNRNKRGRSPEREPQAGKRE